MVRILFILLFISSCLHAQQQAITWVNQDGWRMGLLKYIHPSHVAGHKDPVIIWMHGNGCATDYTNDVTGATNAANCMLTDDGIPKRLNNGDDISAKKAGISSNPLEHFIVLSPAQDISQDGYVSGINAHYIDFMRKYIRDSLSTEVDTTRLYIVGWSGGVSGVWGYPTRSLADAETVAAIVPISGVCISPVDSWCDIATANVGVWAFHAQNDATVTQTCTGGAISNINGCGPIINPIYTNPATGGHFIAMTYTDPAFVGSNGMNIYQWMLQYDIFYGQNNYPPATKINVTPGMLFQTTSARKKPQLLFDGDTTTAWASDFFYGYAIDATNGQYSWIVLDSLYNHPWFEVFNNAFSGGDTVSFQCFYDWTDTTRHSLIFNGLLTNSIWKPIDSINSRAYIDSFRLVRFRIKTGASTGFTEARIHGVKLASAASIYPAPASPPSDEGIYFQGYGKLFGDTLMDDAGASQEIQQNLEYEIPSADASGKTLSLNKFSNMHDAYFAVNQRHGRRSFMYLAGQRPAYDYPDSSNSTKDIPIGSDSTKLTTWSTTDTAYYGVVAKLGHNTSASLTGYSYTLAPAGAGLGDLDEIQVGHEDDAHFDPHGAVRLHMPLVKLQKVKAAVNGAKRADPNIKVHDGALTGDDSDYYKGEYIENLIAYKTKNLPWDIWGFDYYSTNTGTQGSPGSVGISPEQDNAYVKWKLANGVCQRLQPGKEVMIFEYGFDVHDGSNYRVADISGQTRQQTKANWIMRAYEMASATGISRFYMYTQRDLGGGDFGTTGYSYDTLLTNPGSTLPSYLWQFMDAGHLSGGGYVSLPRDLYWHLTMRMSVLQNYKAAGTVIRNGDSTGVWVIRHAHQTDPTLFVDAVWYGTHANTSGTFTLNEPGAISATITKPNIQVKTGTITVPSISSGNISVPADEGMTYVTVRIQSILQTKLPHIRGYHIKI